MENTTKIYSKEDAPTYAYTVLSHLVSQYKIASQQKVKFAEIRDLLGISHDGNWYRDLLEYIVNGIQNLKKEWSESIPPITALVFKRNGKLSEWVCELLTGNPQEQPTSQQIKKVRKDVAAYDKWDKVLEYFKP